MNIVKQKWEYLNSTLEVCPLKIRKLYGFGLGDDFSPFHLILDVSQLDRDEVFQALLMTIDNLVLRKEETPREEMSHTDL